MKRQLLDDSMMWSDLVCITEQGSGCLCNTCHYFLVFAISTLVLEDTLSPVLIFHYPYPNSIIHPAWDE